MIHLIDKVLNSSEADYYYNLITNYKFNWYLSKNIGSKSAEVSDTSYGFAHTMYQSNTEGPVVLSEYYHNTLHVLYKACEQAKLHINDVYASRVFFQTPSQQPGNIIHKHNDISEEHLVFIYYVNDSDGDTVFFDNEDNEIFRQTPKRNTGVIFDGSILHSAETSSQHRFIINYNFSANSL